MSTETTETSWLSNVLSWLKSRLTESSTWTWLTVLAGYLGYTIDPDLLEAIVGVVVAVITFIQVIKKDTNTAIKESSSSASSVEETSNEKEESTSTTKKSISVTIGK